MAAGKIEAAMLHAIQSLGYDNWKEKQAEVVESFLGGHDVFGVLPTGYGKGLFMLAFQQCLTTSEGQRTPALL